MSDKKNELAQKEQDISRIRERLKEFEDLTDNSFSATETIQEEFDDFITLLSEGFGVESSRQEADLSFGDDVISSTPIPSEREQVVDELKKQKEAEEESKKNKKDSTYINRLKESKEDKEISNYLENILQTAVSELEEEFEVSKENSNSPTGDGLNSTEEKKLKQNDFVKRIKDGEIFEVLDVAQKKFAIDKKGNFQVPKSYRRINIEAFNDTTDETLKEKSKILGIEDETDNRVELILFIIKKLIENDPKNEKIFYQKIKENLEY